MLIPQRQHRLTQEHRLWAKEKKKKQAWAQITPLPLTNYVALSKLFNISKPWSPHL